MEETKKNIYNINVKGSKRGRRLVEGEGKGVK